MKRFAIYLIVTVLLSLKISYLYSIEKEVVIHRPDFLTESKEESKNVKKQFEESGFVDLRPLPRIEEDWKMNHGGSWKGTPTYEQQKGNYPFVAKNLDVVSNWMDGDFVTKKVILEHYLGLNPALDELDSKKHAFIKKIKQAESEGADVLQILIYREYRIVIQRGYPNSVAGPYKEDTKILAMKEPESDPYSIRGFTKWMFVEIKGIK